MRVPLGETLSGGSAPPDRGGQRRALVFFALLVVLVHAALLGGADAFLPGPVSTGAASPLTVRVIAAAAAGNAAAEAPMEPMPAAEPEPIARAAPVVTAATARQRPLRRPPLPMPEQTNAAVATQSAQASASSEGRVAQRAAVQPTLQPTVQPAAALAAGRVAGRVAEPLAAEPGSGGGAGQAPTRPASDATAASSAPSAPTLLLAGEPPPPIYRTRLPPALTLRYEVRSGVLRGQGELRWRPTGEGYSLALEAGIAGVTLLRQSSDGEVDGAGLAPARFLDQRARRSRQAANFRRDAGTITFSGTATEWPLLAGSQDRLSFFVQLAAIAAAEPGLRAEGARIVMVVAGARGDAAVWTFRCAGVENVETGLGPVPALKFVRDARSTYDTRAEIWLDPARHYLPAHVSLRNSLGTSEYDLLLDGVEPAIP